MCSTQVRNYNCETCKAFAECGRLTTHKYTHLGEKLYHCNVIERKDITNQYLVTSRRQSSENPQQTLKIME
ncbi:---NA--- [Octopus vulgaris]|uniref:---NA n=1 Tax=Octopus vulgaris TaxID=6645 RepID=A0AA36B044_OCTVU|nr:---NA--- [Octopus vulgaris]